MKLGISTLGCPDWTLDEILTRVPSYGYEGVELRGLGLDLDFRQSPPFATPEAAAETKRAFDCAGLEIISINTSAVFSDPARVEVSLEEARAGIDLAQIMGAPFVRVFPGGIPSGMNAAESAQIISENLVELGRYAEKTGTVSVVLETHDDFSTGRSLADILERVSSVWVGGVWDMHHPFRQGETPAETYAALLPFLKYVQVKDGLPSDKYTLLGEGDVPVKLMIDMLRAGGYDGYLSLEWEKRWHPDLADPSVAFPQYADKLREYLRD